MLDTSGHEANRRKAFISYINSENLMYSGRPLILFTLDGFRSCSLQLLSWTGLNINKVRKSHRSRVVKIRNTLGHSPVCCIDGLGLPPLGVLYYYAWIVQVIIRTSGNIKLSHLYQFARYYLMKGITIYAKIRIN